MEHEEKSNNGSSSSALARMLNQLNLPTLALILLTGGGNFFATKGSSSETDRELQRAIDQIKNYQIDNQETWERGFKEVHVLHDADLKDRQLLMMTALKEIRELNDKTDAEVKLRQQTILSALDRIEKKLSEKGTP